MVIPIDGAVDNGDDGDLVYGCADVTWLNNAWVRRHGDQIVVTCNHSGEVYYVTCDDNHWPLELINCSRGIVPSRISKFW